jgi:purine nucleosidase
MTFLRARWRWVVGAIALLAIAFALTLALPVPLWRTGRSPVASLELHAGQLPANAGARVWVDTDAACGAGARTDADDCLALALLLRSRGVRVVGISTVFGNASLAVTDRVTRVVAQMFASAGNKPAVHTGAANASATHTPARDAMRRALREGPLTIVVLGPLTNVAAALDGEPEVQGNVAQLIAVMGHRAGHVFHPTEGASGATLFGHGPIFRDFNFAKDEEAAARVLAMNLAITLVPYDASRELAITGEDLLKLEDAGGPLRWIAHRSRDWLSYWEKDIGQQGFYAFDLAAAAFLIHPDAFECARVPARVAANDAGWAWLFSARSLIVGPEANEGDGVPATLNYCPRARASLKRRLMAEMIDGAL